MSIPHIKPFVLGEYQTNCFVVTSQAVEAGEQCVIIDCGFEPEEMLDWIDSKQLEPQAIVLTHAHVDHIAGVDQALSRFERRGPVASIPVYIHEAEAKFCEDPLLNLSALSGFPATCRRPDLLLRDGQSLELCGITWRVLHTPGHSPGGIALVHDESKQAIVGDTLFAGSIGRFDFPTSNVEDLRRSLREVLMMLPDDMTIYAGHGPKTTIGRERRTNPYVVGGF